MIRSALAALVVAGLSAAQEGGPLRPPGAEGPIDNDVFVPASDAAAKALGEGDSTLERGRATERESERARLLDAAFDAWRLALAEGGRAGLVWLDPGPMPERRVLVGVRAAVERRWGELSAPERARWTARVEPQAAAALAALSPGLPLADLEARLEEVVRLHPFTPSAARAALRLGDLALEAGLAARAAGWLARAAQEAEGAGAPELGAARSRRPAPPEGGAPTESWETAAGAVLLGSLSWAPPFPGRAGVDPAGERWLRPGAAFLGPGEAVVQTPGELVWLRRGEREVRTVARVRTNDLVDGDLPDPDPPREPPGWPLLPVVDARGVVLVVGRSRRDEPNALVAVTLTEPGGRLGLGLDLGPSDALARREWAIVGSERLDADGVVEEVPGLLELGNAEFQPGPVLCADRVVVQARQLDGAVRAWLLAFDRRDGRLAWKQLLGSGADRVATTRFGANQKALASQPLLAFEEEGLARVFAGTHLGLGALTDGLDGEIVWAFKNRRRDEREPGWSGDRPVLGPGPGHARALLWAPRDSDRLYFLRPGAVAGGTGAEAVLLAPPAPLEDATALLGGGSEGWVVLGSTGKERTVSLRRPGRDRVDALDLGREERFRGIGLLSPTRAWVSSSTGLYLFDRTRELYLLDYQTLPQSGIEAPGGDLFARDADVLVVGSSALWWFRAR